MATYNTALGSFAGTTAIARKILLDIIEALDIPKQEGQVEKNYTWEDKIYYQVPNVEGMSVKEGKKLLTNWHIEYIGSGDKIISQSPKPGIRLASDDTIVSLLGN